MSFVNLLDSARGKGPTGMGVPPLVRRPRALSCRLLEGTYTLIAVNRSGPHGQYSRSVLMCAIGRSAGVRAVEGDAGLPTGAPQWPPLDSRLSFDTARRPQSGSLPVSTCVLRLGNVLSPLGWACVWWWCRSSCTRTSVPRTPSSTSRPTRCRCNNRSSAITLHSVWSSGHLWHIMYIFACPPIIKPQVAVSFGSGDVAGGRGGGHTRVSPDVGDPRHAGTHIFSISLSSRCLYHTICGSMDMSATFHLASPSTRTELPFFSRPYRRPRGASVWLSHSRVMPGEMSDPVYMCTCRCRCQIWRICPTCPIWLTCPTFPACLWDSRAADPLKVLACTAMHRAILNLRLEKEEDCVSLV